MNKKTYQQPSVKVVLLDPVMLTAGSITTGRLTDDPENSDYIGGFGEDGWNTGIPD